MNYIEEQPKPSVLGAGSYAIAVVLHLVFFALLFCLGELTFHEDETVIPIDLTVVMQENLDGDENEPPPVPEVKPPEPEPPKPEPPKPEPPKPEPPKPEPPKPEPPKPVEPPPAVVKEPVKTNKVAEVKKPEKTAAELRAERIAAMLASAKDVKPPKPRATNGKTGPKTLSDAEIAKMLALGYRPGATESIATDEMTRCVSLVRKALEEKQDLLRPEMGRDGKVMLTIRFDRTGRVRDPALAGSCGDPKTDAAALRIVRSLDVIRGLSSAFLEQFSKTPLTIEYSMTTRR